MASSTVTGGRLALVHQFSTPEPRPRSVAGQYRDDGDQLGVGCPPPIAALNSPSNRLLLSLPMAQSAGQRRHPPVPGSPPALLEELRGPLRLGPHHTSWSSNVPQQLGRRQAEGADRQLSRSGNSPACPGELIPGDGPPATISASRESVARRVA